MFILLNMKKDANGALDSFKSFIEKIKMERMRKQRLSDVEIYLSLNHFIWNGIHTIQYQIILGDCEDIAKIIPKRYYSLVIAIFLSVSISQTLNMIVTLILIKHLVKWLRDF